MSSSSSSSIHTRSAESRGKSSLGFDYEGPAMYCKCGLKSPLVTSMSDENPGRRFFGCSNYKVKGCNFFVWHDCPISDQHVKALLIELKNRNKNLYKENSVLKKENRLLTEMVGDVKGENEYLRNMQSVQTMDTLFSDEMATLKAEIEVAHSKLKDFENLARREAKARKFYLYTMILMGLLLLLTVGFRSNCRKNICPAALP